MATLIKSDGSNVELNPFNGKDFSLEELQQAVGGYIEIVPIDKEFDMVVNEEGKLYGLPVNEQATRLYRRVRYTDDVIVGDVVLCNKEQLV